MMGKTTMQATRIAVLSITFLLGSTQLSFGMDDCCTPEATAKIAASAGFTDMAGIKPGMSAEQAVAALKAANAGYKIDVLRSDTNWDYLAMLNNDSRKDPKKLWMFGIQAVVQGVSSDVPDQMNIALTVPPTNRWSMPWCETSTSEKVPDPRSKMYWVT